MSGKIETKEYADPKIPFLTCLIRDMENIYNQLCSSDPIILIEGTHSMSVFIQLLDVPSGKEYDEIRNLQDKWTPDVGYYTGMFHTAVSYHIQKSEMSDSEIFHIWRVLSAFMNATYFKGWNGSRPQEKTPMRPL